MSPKRSRRSSPIVGTSVSTTPATRSDASLLAPSTAAHNAAPVDMLSPTSTTRSYRAASATLSKSVDCALNPTRSRRASSTGARDVSASATTPASHESAPAVVFVSPGSLARAPYTAVGMSGWTSARRCAMDSMPQWSPWPATTPTGWMGPDRSSEGDATDVAPRLTGCHGTVRRTPSGDLAAGARSSGAASKMDGGSGLFGRSRRSETVPRRAERGGDARTAIAANAASVVATARPNPRCERQPTGRGAPRSESKSGARSSEDMALGPEGRPRCAVRARRTANRYPCNRDAGVRASAVKSRILGRRPIAERESSVKTRRHLSNFSCSRIKFPREEWMQDSFPPRDVVSHTC